MVFAYGLACALAVLLSFLHRPAVPYALVLAGGWLLGFLPFEVWWIISLGQGAAVSYFLRHDSPLWPRVIACCIVLSLICDGAFWMLESNGFYFGGPYENALNVLLLISLLSAAWPGGSKLVGLGIALYRRTFAGLGVGSGVGAASRRCSTAGPDGNQARRR